jgi:uncharacterized SAM-binding protein YcdF (DUF218 family)
MPMSPEARTFKTFNTGWWGVFGRVSKALEAHGDGAELSRAATHQGAMTRGSGLSRYLHGAAVSAQRAAAFITTSAAVIVSLNGAAGYIIFGNAVDSAVSRVDAVIVLGGEHDGREGYGLALARQGLASAVVLSDPYPAADPLMSRMCLPRNDVVEVICSRPDPATTRGEAMMTRRLAGEHDWKRILIVSWRYHLPRARFVFHQCLSAMSVSIAAKAVPRHYVLPVWYWQYIYLYQFAGIAKAATIDHC